MKDYPNVPATSDVQQNIPFVYQSYSHAEIDDVSKKFYVAAMESMNSAGIPYLVGGAYAFAQYSKIERHTKDFDIFVRKQDASKVLVHLAHSLKSKSDRTYPHWLYKSILGENFIDIIFSSGNGIAIVDDTWFEKSGTGVVLGVLAPLIPAEEMIWSKGFIMERERYDGADIAHIIHGWGHKMDWKRLIDRYAEHWRVLFSHLVLFGYIYPAEKGAIPDWVMDEMTRRLVAETHKITQENGKDPSSTSQQLDSKFDPTNPGVCRGPLLSRQQYLKDVAEWRYEDARTLPGSDGGPVMSDDEVAHWTAAAFEHGNGNP